MDQNEQRTILLGLIKSLRENDSWCGETHIQKAMFSLQKITGIPIDYTFVLYKHGAFSFDLRDELTDMRADHLLSLEIHPAPYGPSLIVSDSGNAFYKKYHGIVRIYDPAIEFVAKNLGGKGVAELERISTALYVCKEEGVWDPDDCAARVNELKPHISIESAKSATLDAVRILRAYKEQCQ
ncbi:MAG: hypothetical protein ACOX3E_16125 [Desulfomonilia bacterium]|jgi:hypothetical protein|nr:hypothetical protein [Pseudomonadota bacterium]HON38028.1 hypothetical protein [Deltaproteobacteria bacterium]HRS55045.1 hypothetical protein [Desulfomonilia bacterium]HPD20762.1 hypothetical protein [Deltaproteobacteria bacterium]HPX18562.1 hypothetical protein [Deltaproteobacteria bacterium]